MSTRNLDMEFVNRARKALEDNRQDVASRDEQVSVELDELEKERKSVDGQLESDLDNMGIMERTLRQRAADARADIRDRGMDLGEERAQLRYILGSSPAAPAVDDPEPEPNDAPKAPFDQDDAPAPVAEGSVPKFTRTQLTNMTNVKLMRIAKIYGMDRAVTDGNRDAIIVAILACQAVSQSDEPTPPETGVVVVQTRIYDVREWTGVQWLLAIIGLVIGLIVAGNTWEGVVDNMDGFARSLIATAYYLGVLGIGFFGGGFLGSFFDRNED